MLVKSLVIYDLVKVNELENSLALNRQWFYPVTHFFGECDLNTRETFEQSVENALGVEKLLFGFIHFICYTLLFFPRFVCVLFYDIYSSVLLQ